MSTYKGNPKIPALVTGTEIPDDAAKLMASDVNVPFEAIFDNFAYLKDRGVAGVYSYVFDSENPINNGMVAEEFTTNAYVDGTKVLLDVPGTRVGDVVLVDFSGYLMCEMKAVGEWGNVRLIATQQYGGAGAVTSVIPGARIFMLGVYNLPGDPPGVRHFNTMGSMTGGLEVSLAGTVRLGVQGRAGVSGGAVTILSIAKLRGVLLRPV